MTKRQKETAPRKAISSPLPAHPESGRPIRILYVHNSADFYGASRSLFRLISNLDRSQFQAVVLLPSEGPLATELKKFGTVVVSDKLSIITRSAYKPARLPGFLLRVPGAILHVAKLIRKEKIDLVHTNVGVVVSTAASALLTRTPHVWHIRDWFGEFWYLWPAFSRYIIWGSCCVLTPSQDTANQFPRSKKLQVIHNGFRLSEFPAPPPEDLLEFKGRFNLDGRFVVGCVGRIKLVRKGQDTLLHAAALLKKKYPQFRYLIVGAPFKDNLIHLDELKQLIKSLDLELDVVLTGELSDPKTAYAAMDVSILPSAQPEPFGGVVLESMCMGIPVIGTNIGGTPEMIQHETTGLLFTPGDAQELAKRIEELYQSPEKRKTLAHSARKQIETRFSLTSTVNQIQDVYKRCLNRPFTNT